jgi:hypothetical protein
VRGFAHRSGSTGVAFGCCSDDEDEGDEEGSSLAGDSSKSVKYFCRTPSPVSDTDLVEDTAELTQRHLKRIKRRDGQRLAARAAMLLSMSEVKISLLSLPMGKNIGTTKFRSMPVLEPSVFLDDNTVGWTVVRRRRWSPAIDVNT